MQIIGIFNGKVFVSYISHTVLFAKTSWYHSFRSTQYRLWDVFIFRKYFYYCTETCKYFPLRSYKITIVLYIEYTQPIIYVLKPLSVDVSVNVWWKRRRYFKHRTLLWNPHNAFARLWVLLEADIVNIVFCGFCSFYIVVTSNNTLVQHWNIIY